ncbi:alpha-2-macroglobulin family protein [Roseivirga misakiensis]|uniref:Alpha-2-macroglobulin domain-containing protein n=1 Tax=Roseivirga misakiensis TaxID=1563681 RepID=A0A1E5T712_9BACT|nr:MG2 domain-containing protein [Roseivirga misakiensis]OEK07161.1 hypothetical protein BFP71_05750 [Roseivirga misakiensis]
MISTKPIFLLIIALFVPMIGWAQAEKNDTLWQEVYRFEKEGLTKSAQEKVLEILNNAAEESDAEELLKATIYQSKFWLLLEENARLKVMDNLQKRISAASAPEKSIYQLVAAKSLFDFYLRNSYDINQRDEAKVDTVDFNFWNKTRFQSEIHRYYQNALADYDKVDTLRLDTYRGFFRRVGVEEPKIELVSDFIAEQAFRFYFYNLQLSDFKSRSWLPTLENYWNSIAFLNLKIDPPVGQSFIDHGFKQLQKILLRQKANGNTKRYVNWELFRLKLLKNRANNDLSAYLEALDRLMEDLDDATKVTVLFEKAQTLNMLGSRYNFQRKGDQFRWAKKSAHDICDDIIRLKPNSFEAKQADVLKESIEQSSLMLTHEDFIIPSNYSRVLVEFANLKSLELSIYKGNMDKLKQLIVPTKTPFSKKFEALELIRKWAIDLPQVSDYQRHATEVLIDPLAENGQYLLVVKQEGSEEPLHFGIFQVSNLTFISLPTTSTNEFLISDRETGQPEPNADIIIQSTNNSYQKPFHRRFKSNNNGRIRYNSNDYRYGLTAKVMTALDTAYFQNIRLSRVSKPQKSGRITVSAHLFTDRAIYRPGQMMYFKGILYKTESEKQATVTNEEVLVTVYDENYDEIYEKYLRSNEFGSFTDSLRIPKSVLTGDFSIEVEEPDNESEFFDQPNVYLNAADKYFRVENYKRPKFELRSDPIKEAYVLGDSVEFTGSAVALAGSNVSNATVKYTITRTGYRLGLNEGFFGYSYPSQEEYLLAEGETKTDNKGQFKIKFKASGNASEDREKLPIFSYDLRASVTDINGETRNLEESLYIGYHEGRSSISAPVEVEEGKEISLKVSVTNLNGQQISRPGILSVYKLDDEEKYLKERLWKAPDLPIISKEDFAKRFPYEPYEQIDPEVNQKLISKIILSSIDDIYKIEESKQWGKGSYKIIFETTDQSIQKSSLSLFIKSKEPEKDRHSVFEINQNKNTYQHKDNLVISLYSSLDFLTVTLFLDQGGEINKEYIFNLSKGERLLSLPIKPRDVGGYTIHYLAQAEGMAKYGKLDINVPDEEHTIKIETTSFRSKLEPGQKEEWSFKIKGDESERIEAELLASMYDASLDQFVTHDWYLPSSPTRTNYSSANIDLNQSYSKNILQSLLSRRYQPYRIPNKSFYKLELFGYNFVNPREGQNNYQNISFSPQNKEIISVADDEEFETLMEVPVTNQALAGKVAGVQVQPSNQIGFRSPIQIRGASTLAGSDSPLIIVDGVIVEGGLSQVNLQEAASYEVLKGASAASLYGSRAANGVIVISTKGGMAAAQQDNEALLGQVKSRTNFKETAFFYPQLRTSKNGELSFSFTTPESLTKWNLQLLAHTKSMLTDKLVSTVQTQKKLMVLPNFPRFVREKDTLIVSVKVASLFSKKASGVSRIEWLNPENNEPIDLLIKGDRMDKAFEIAPNGNAAMEWKISVPAGLSGIKYRVLATAGGFSDGEENYLPVLSNKVMITESLPMWVNANEEKAFKLDALEKASETKENYSLSLGFTNNSLWNVVQSLPYMIEFPYECSEQTFSRIFANAIGRKLVEQHPTLSELISKWSKDEKQGPLFANENLKSIALKETPWLLNAKNKDDRLKNLSRLLNKASVDEGLNIAINKLSQMQMVSGAFPWFSGSSYPNKTITMHVVAGFGQMKKLSVDIDNYKVEDIIGSALGYLDRVLVSDYKQLANDTSRQADLQTAQIHLLYAKSFYDSLKTNVDIKNAEAYFLKMGEDQWLQQNLQSKAMLALVYYRAGNIVMAKKIMNSLEENATKNDRGMYWLENESSFDWYQMPIETHARIMEAFAEILPDEKRHQKLMQWLIQNKRANAWASTKATADAIYTLLNSKGAVVNEQNAVFIEVGNDKISTATDEKTDLFTQKDWKAEEIQPDLAQIQVKNEGANPSWGAMHYQYFESLENVAQRGGSLQVRKEVFKIGANEPYQEQTNHTYKVGDRVKVRLSLSADQDMEFLHLKDLRAAGFEPMDVLSGYKRFGNAYAYQAIDDTSIHFFFDELKKGKYVVEYELIVNNAGSFSTGIATIESMYAPEFNAKAKAIAVKLEKN